jgi:hypothetical protein
LSNSSEQTDADATASWSTTITLGADCREPDWSRHLTLGWPEIASRLTTHRPGSKDGLCFTPAVFSGSRRQQIDAARIDLGVLDVESGHGAAYVKAALERRGYAGTVSTTYRHLLDETEVPTADYHKFEAATGTKDAPSRYLIERKGMLPAVVAGAVIWDEDNDHIILKHKACPRLRIAVPLLRPWLASHYADQWAAIEGWKAGTAALAHDLGVVADPTGFEPAHLFFWPRFMPGGVPPEAFTIPGKPVDLFALPHAPKTSRTVPPRKALIDVPPDLPENVTEAKRYLRDEAPIATEGAKGDRRTVNVCMELHDRGISEALAFDLLSEEGGWNDRCLPPWRPDDLQIKVGNGFKYASNDFGSKTIRAKAQAAFGSVHVETPQPEMPDEPTPTRIDWGWWLNRPLIEPEPLLANVIVSGGKVMFGGKTGSGKSHFAEAVAGALATGRSFLHWPAPKQPISVLYVDGEMANTLVQQRLRDLHRRMGQPQTNMLHFLCRHDFPDMEALDTPGGRAFVLHHVDLWKPRLIVLDSRMCLLQGELTKAETWQRTMPLLHEVTRRGIAQMWIEHMGIATDRLYGDSSKEWLMDAVGLFDDATEQEKKKAGTDLLFRLTFKKARRRTPENRADFQPVTISLRADAWHWAPDGGKPSGKVSPSRQIFYDALRNIVAANHATTEGKWLAECIRLGLVEPAEEGETSAQRGNRLRPFRRAKSELATQKLICVDGLNIFDAGEA